ncbi:MAG: hypothetical protein KAX49_07810 [Halanaerobiales bacterium]|nr:hypothetical protein [Halanaerobiales bacterium]
MYSKFAENGYNKASTNKIDIGEKDILKRLRDVTIVKFEIMTKYPHLFNFFNSIYLDDSKEIAKDILNKSEEKRREEIWCFYKVF